MTIRTWEELKLLLNNQWPDDECMKAEISELRAELAAIRNQQPVAYRAWFDKDSGARFLFTLWPGEERLDVDWEPLFLAAGAQPRCPHCDGTGDVHSIDGEWRGVCDCGAGAGKGKKASLPERDKSKPAEKQGLFRKFVVRRVDGSDLPGGKHDGCEYFVLDVTRDRHAPDALRAYAKSCATTHPQLSEELEARWGAQPVPDDHDWRFSGVDNHKGEHWYECSRCGATDWIASYGTRDQLTSEKCCKAAPEAKKPEQEAAVRTLQHLGYTYHGAELWKPPIDSPASARLRCYKCGNNKTVEFAYATAKS